MTETTWDPSDTGSWTLSNGDLTATSPDNNTPQSVFVAFAQNPIPDDAKTYFEYTVSGAAVQTAFTVGFGVHGFNPSAVNLADEGAIIPNATFLGFSYNLGIANSGDVIYDPQNNAPSPRPIRALPVRPTDGRMAASLVFWLTGSTTPYSSH
jgi:hypothetical protein